MGITDELAKERNRAAAERTLMAWIRTCLSLISFGFGLDKIIAAIRSNASSGPGHAQLSVRLVAVSFVLTGILAMVAATVQHRHVTHPDRPGDPGAAGGGGPGILINGGSAAAVREGGVRWRRVSRGISPNRRR
jgi:uncharacterized membrane protein YidH (DUF202 family)